LLSLHAWGLGAHPYASAGEIGKNTFTQRIKTDDTLVAPGEKILAPILDEGFERRDGTSMAAPHVSGAAAMLMAARPELMGEPMRIKKILCETATDLGRERYFQGHGVLDILRAIESI
jgi:serine protease AprX